MTERIPTKEEILQAHERISPFIHNTPIFTSQRINDFAGAKVYFKCENFQKVGAFKARGATNAVLSMPQAELKNGVATHSSGNHAQALALAAKNRGVKARIVMPSTAPKIKKEAVLGYGAEVIECEPTQKAREDGLAQVISETGAIAVHPYDNYKVIEGQATAAKELIESMDDERLDYIIVPVGGGGLLSGTILAAKYFSPSTKVIAGEPKGADDAYHSWKAGELKPCISPKSIADGLLSTLGKLNFGIISEGVDDIITVSDEETVKAMRLIWEGMKIIIEPSCAVAVAALFSETKRFKNKKVGVILTGGNVDLEKLPF